MASITKQLRDNNFMVRAYAEQIDKAATIEELITIDLAMRYDLKVRPFLDNIEGSILLRSDTLNKKGN